MGCDIHFYAEVCRNGKWEVVGIPKQPDPGEDYKN